MKLEIIDWLVIFFVPISALIASFIYRKRFPGSVSRQGFALANQKLGSTAVASTYIGANITFTSIFLILSQEGYKRGYWAFSIPLFWILGTLFFLYLYPRIRTYITNGITMHQAIGSTFNNYSVKFYASVWTIIAFILTVGLEFYGGIKLISAANVPLLSYVSIGLIFIICVGYFTAKGGLGGVAYADVVLNLLTISGAAVLTSGFISFIFSLISNHFPEIITSNNQIIPFPSLEENVIFTLSMLVLFIPFQFCTFDSWQRLSSRKNRETSPNLLIFTSGLIVSLVFCVPIFLGIYLRSENIFVDVSNNGLVLFEFLKYHTYQPFYIGLICAGFIAAVFSTADELLNCCSYSYISDALEVPENQDAKSQVFSFRFYVIIACVISTILALLGLNWGKEITEIGLAVFSTQIVFVLPLYFVFFKKEIASNYALRVKYSMIISFVSTFTIVATGWLINDKLLIEGAPIGSLIIGIFSFCILSIFIKK